MLIKRNFCKILLMPRIGYRTVKSPVHVKKKSKIAHNFFVDLKTTFLERPWKMDVKHYVCYMLEGLFLKGGRHPSLYKYSDPPPLLYRVKLCLQRERCSDWSFIKLTFPKNTIDLTVVVYWKGNQGVKYVFVSRCLYTLAGRLFIYSSW